MPAKPPMPTVRLRRLAAELRRLRAANALTRDDVSESTGINAASLYRIETARVRPQPRTLMSLLDVYQVERDRRPEIMTLLKESKSQGWLRPYHAELPEEYAAYIAFEAEANAIRNYESLYVPGLLQTDDYARAMIRGVSPGATSKRIDQSVQSRLERQEALVRSNPLALWAILDEAALHRLCGGPSIMRAQLERLISASDEPHVTLQVVPFGAGPHPGMMGSFVLMSFPEAESPEIIYIESLAGDLFLESDVDLQRYSSMFDVLRAVAIGPAETTHLIKSLISEL